jgi:hypothetical protein
MHPFKNGLEVVLPIEVTYEKIDRISWAKVLGG